MNSSEWQRLCTESLQRSQQRRHTPTPHPWPARGEWLTVFLTGLVIVGFCYVLLVLAAAVVPGQ